jgi:CRISPR-associated protein (TIGR03985 family)
VPQEQQDRVDDWQDKLRELWQEDPIPPVKLHYWSASLLRTCTAVVYPVCIYHYRRGPYLCGFGEIPEQPMERLDWRNYRLDRIQAIARLDWDNPQVPRSLLNRQQRNQLPTPDEIELRMAQAWGFDYYQPVQRLLLRFDQEWDKRYIRNSLRHVTFEPIDYVEAGRLIKQELTGVQQKHLLRVWQARSKDDAYYQALYRQDDPNVKQRLRAWRPHVEVLLPWGLRLRFVEEVKQELRFYHDEFD